MKQKKHSYKVVWITAIVCMIFLAGFAYFVMFSVGYANNRSNGASGSYSLFPVAQSDVPNEYNKRIQTYNEDVNTYNALISEAKNLKSNDADALYTYGLKVANEYSLIKSHITEMNSFILANENELKQAGVDTYKMKKQISDFDINFQNFANNIKTAIENYKAQTSQQAEQLQSLLKIFSSLLI